MSSFFDRFVPRDVLAVAWSLDHEPRAWEPGAHGGKLYTLTHSRTGLRVWAANRSYGVEIKDSAGRLLFGGVTVWSSFRLSPGHRVLSNAIERWERANAPLLVAPPLLSAAELLAGESS